LDCSTIEDCTPAVGKKHYVFWYDCSGQPFKAAAPTPTGALSSTAACEEQVVIAQESEVNLTWEKFAIARNGSHSRENWRRRYTIGKELGAGQTATVFEAYATAQEELPAPENGAKNDKGVVPSLGRRVALKKLNASGSSMFRQEVRALVQVGVHPHILRLLECFCDGDEDILILEFCDGGDVYDLYASKNGVGFAEVLVSQIIRQVLMALDHLNQRNVEHRDLKPENLLLYGYDPTSSASPHIKLADFGWASIIGPDRKPAPVPADGVGSLWYAPPELNPPVAGVTPTKRSDLPIGKSDLWSVGIITYLLLVGHSPFNLALRITEPRAREDEVLKLAALGNLNTNARNYAKISNDARSFIKALIVPQPSSRMSVEESWNHPFISKYQPRTSEISRGVPSPVEKMQVWRGLDGFQRLCWLSIARAVAEPELLEGAAFKMLIAGQQVGSGSMPYLEQLASDLAGTAIPAWFQVNTAWADVLRLAFRYLDGDGDGVLSVPDLSRHIVSDDADKVSTLWLLRWQGGVTSLAFPEYRAALWSTFGIRQRVHELALARPYDGTNEKDAIASIVSLDESVEAALQMRFGSIDQVCDRFIETEGTFEGFDVDHSSWTPS